MSTQSKFSAATTHFCDVLDTIREAHFVERHYAEPITNFECNLDYCSENPIITFYSLGGPETEVILPRRATSGSIGFDIRYNRHFQENDYDRESTSLCIPKGKSTIVSTGVRALVDVLCANSYLQIMSRSGLASKGIIATGGVIDTDYTGEIKVILSNITDQDFTICHGDKIAQLVLIEVPYLLNIVRDPIEGGPGIYPKPEGTAPVSTERNEGGFGSTGK